MHHDSPMKHGKKYSAVAEKIEKKAYGVAEAVELLKGGKIAKFDETVEIHAKLGINPKRSDENVRGTVELPAGTGKTKRVAVITTTKTDEARAAGATLVGDLDLIEKIKAGEMNFDVLIATPEMMPKLAPVAKVLGPRGMMPSPKAETVTVKIKEAVEALGKGTKLTFKNDNTSNVHAGIAKLSMTAAQIESNVNAFLEVLRKSKPEAAKGQFVKSVYLTTTMGPSIQVIL